MCLWDITHVYMHYAWMWLWDIMYVYLYYVYTQSKRSMLIIQFYAVCIILFKKYLVNSNSYWCIYVIHINKQHTTSCDYQLGGQIYFCLKKHSFKMFQKLNKFATLNIVSRLSDSYHRSLKWQLKWHLFIMQAYSLYENIDCKTVNGKLKCKYKKGLFT